MRELGLSKALDEYHKLLDNSEANLSVIKPQTGEYMEAEDAHISEEGGPSLGDSFSLGAIAVALIAPPLPSILRPEIIIRLFIGLWELFASLIYTFTALLVPLITWYLFTIQPRSVFEGKTGLHTPSSKLHTSWDVAGTLQGNLWFNDKKEMLDFVVHVLSDMEHHIRSLNLGHQIGLLLAVFVVLFLSERTVSARRKKIVSKFKCSISHRDIELFYTNLSPNVRSSQMSLVGGLTTSSALHAHSQEEAFIEGVRSLMREYGCSQFAPKDVNTLHDAMDWLVAVAKDVDLDIKISKSPSNGSSIESAIKDLASVREALLGK